MTQQMPTPQTPATQASETTIQPGVYQMRAVEAELGYTQGSEGSPPAPQVAILFEFCDGPYKGTSLTWYGFFSEKTKAGTIRALRLTGWQGDNLADLSTCRGEAPCVIQVEPDLQGVARAKIRFVGGGVIAMKNVMNEEQKKAFAASMMAFAATINASAPTDKPASNGPTGQAGQKFF